MDNSQLPSELEQAPEHIKLAVDLIMLLEQNEIPAQVALDALDIVRQDCLSKIAQSAP